MVNKLLRKARDWLGRAFDRRTLDEDQSSRIAGLRHEFAGHPSRGLTPAKLASIMQDAESGNLIDQADLFEDMEEKDSHIFAELSKRKRVLLGLNWSLKTPRDASAQEERAADQVRDWIEDTEGFEDLLFDMADAIGKGYSNVELSWKYDGKIMLPAFTHRPARWFTVDQNDQDRILLRDNSGGGEALEPFGWIAHVHKAKSGYITRGGLHRVLAWPFLFKNYSVRDLAEFLEIYGIPARLGRYPHGASDKDKTTLLAAVTGIGHNAAGIIPEGMDIEFQSAAEGHSDPYKVMIDWCESSESKAILGGTLTSSAQNIGLGANLGDVHNEVRHDLMVSDARQIAATLTRDLVWPLIALNIGGIDPGRAPRFEFQTQQPEDLALLSEAVPKLVDIGMRIPVSWAHEKLQIPEPDEEEPVLQRGGGTAPPPADPAAARLAAARGEPLAPDAIDRYTDRLQRESQPALHAMFERVRQLLDETESLEALQDRLLSIYGDLDPAELAEVMQFGFSAAELAGRFDVDQGN